MVGRVGPKDGVEAKGFLEEGLSSVLPLEDLFT